MVDWAVAIIVVPATATAVVEDSALIELEVKRGSADADKYWTFLNF